MRSRRFRASTGAAYVDRLAEELDASRLDEALDAMLVEQRRRGSPVDDLIAHGATIFIRGATRGRVEVRLGWLDDWPGQNVHGGGMTLGFVALDDLSVSTARACRST